MSQEKSEANGRREIASRDTKWANKIARWLAVQNITPNQISMMSVFFSAIGGGMLLCSAFCPYISYYISLPAYALCIQLRLLCNLFDGMVAIEGGKKSENGDLYNDIPDRFADALLIIPVGYVAGGIGVELSWLAALLAVMTAYFRWIGAYKTGEHYFKGPMAKQHRMALLTITALIAIPAIYIGYYKLVFLVSLIVLNLGLIATLINRLYLMSHTSAKKK